jgi:YbgC/YbaW family acyl-CoA thioester hydrolase
MVEESARFRVGWIDTDAGGRIHFTSVFRWVEVVETELLRRLELLQQVADLPRRKVEAEFTLPLVFDDEVDVTLRIERVGRTSITFTWDVLRRGALAIRGSHVVVHVDETGRPAPVDERVRAAAAE